MPAPQTTAEVEVGDLFSDETGLMVVFEVYLDIDHVDAYDADGNLVPFDNFQELLDERVLVWEERAVA